jgi:ankyrin repeat protein
VNAFLDAVRAGDIRTVQTMLGQRPSLATSADDNGRSAILVAVEAGHPRVVDALVAAGADLDVFACAALGRANELDILLGLDPTLATKPGPGGDTALHLAARFGHADAARVLLGHGADRACLDDAGASAADLARAQGHDEVAALLGSAPDG